MNEYLNAVPKTMMYEKIKTVHTVIKLSDCLRIANLCVGLPAPDPAYYLAQVFVSSWGPRDLAHQSIHFANACAYLTSDAPAWACGRTASRLASHV